MEYPTYNPAAIEIDRLWLFSFTVTLFVFVYATAWLTYALPKASRWERIEKKIDKLLDYNHIQHD